MGIVFWYCGVPFGSPFVLTNGCTRSTLFSHFSKGKKGRTQYKLFEYHMKLIHFQKKKEKEKKKENGKFWWGIRKNLKDDINGEK